MFTSAPLTLTAQKKVKMQALAKKKMHTTPHNAAGREKCHTNATQRHKTLLEAIKQKRTNREEQRDVSKMMTLLCFQKSFQAS